VLGEFSDSERESQDAEGMDILQQINTWDNSSYHTHNENPYFGGLLHVLVVGTAQCNPILQILDLLLNGPFHP